MLLPKEHGAYAQMAFPLVTALVVSGPSRAGLLVVAAVCAGFIAHEPVAVLLGARGPRARRESGGAAVRQLAACLIVGVIAALAALVTMDPSSRASLVYPAVPALAVGVATVSRRDKSWFGEVAAAVAFSAAAVPVARAGGATLRDALSIALPFALLFVASTLAVRVVVLRVRGGGDRRAVAVTKAALLVFILASALAIGALATSAWIPLGAALASAPGVATSLLVAARPPSPARLRVLGWALVAACVVTGGILAGTL
jgi:hypothetical protein